MDVDATPDAGRQQDRHAVAGLFRNRSLRTRFSLLVGFIVALVVGAAAFVELRMFTSRMESELIDRRPRHRARGGRRCGAAIAGGRSTVVEAAVLHEFLEVDPAVGSITVIRMDGQTAGLVLSTSTEERPAALDVAERAIGGRRRDRRRRGPDPLRRRSVRRARRAPMAAVVTVSTAAVERCRPRRAACSRFW